MAIGPIILNTIPAISDIISKNDPNGPATRLPIKSFNFSVAALNLSCADRASKRLAASSPPNATISERDLPIASCFNN